MRNLGWRGLVGVALALAATALPVAAQPYKAEYSLSIVPDAGTPWGKGTQLWAEMVRERTRGRINIRLHPGAALVGGDQTREFSALRQGVIDIAVGSTINWSSAIPEFNVFSLPFLLRGYRSLDALTQGDVGRELFRRVEEQGVVPLAWGENGFRQLSNSRRPIRTPEDMRGLRFRVVGSLLFNDIFTALGAVPAQMTWNEAFRALRARKIDGQENPITIYNNVRLDTVGQRYITVWDYVADPIVFVVNRQVWDSWSPQDRDIVREAAVEAARFEVTLAREDLLSSGRGMWEDLEARGVKVTRLTPEQRQRFVDATRPVYTKWKALVGRDLVEKAEAAVRDESATGKPQALNGR
ncbi:DctP family TRAP transporter solute-binding subunit [Pandoraea nosoerga]|uniref:C4-dicarboxylate ABC transporter n=1 Tax=Pandoraea nosoerga TaxID=2508296 RepID=A0A5E4V4H7_9BURK|nr:MULTISPECIES: DctP family TRAP transporter solute-binding subunit [Pandoraea]MBN4665736.1 DctP family TRAP transporter solute-binding subunit [Pandoraea nosoerga]MBN4677443.1 DctP family TRAP transporter solute-binding subunit [Pandoraea nosoerga]MBN4681052.1 DctP family TRAP transporter solute-binding subunit [Pandoraea nosoerga]MBN4746658.1 DctP family TRAP transporter solute-binding subunit [Pandoraea nosoerga]VVE07136.1 C4-dicarboxylate ABC transporter [Pandoraea nosoerga]